MSETKWVQHVSGQGEKFEVVADNGFQFGLKHPITSIGWHFVPKSEYVPCDPPEVWEDVSSECEVFCGVEISHQGADVTQLDGYRLRKVTLCDVHQFTPGGMNAQITAFIVERRKA